MNIKYKYKYKERIETSKKQQRKPTVPDRQTDETRKYKYKYTNT